MVVLVSCHAVKGRQDHWIKRWRICTGLNISIPFLVCNSIVKTLPSLIAKHTRTMSNNCILIFIFVITFIFKLSFIFVDLFFFSERQAVFVDLFVWGKKIQWGKAQMDNNRMLSPLLMVFIPNSYLLHSRDSLCWFWMRE